MIQKIKHLIEEFRNRERKILRSTLESEWAHVYHDSIRGKEWLEKMPLHVGRWAGNYTFFYLLNRILTTYKPLHILEFGLGESSKFISAFLEHELKEGHHTVIEESDAWKAHFTAQHELSQRTKIRIHPLQEQQIKGFPVNTYGVLNEISNQKFDLYVVDGPFGSPRYSRYDIVSLAEHFDAEDEFMIVFDDYDREGEQDTVNDLLELLGKKGIKFYKSTYVGAKRILVVGTDKYKFVESL